MRSFINSDREVALTDGHAVRMCAINLEITKSHSKSRTLFWPMQPLTSKLMSSVEVQFHWCIAAADLDFNVQDEETESELLKGIVEMFITVCGFTY